jgi:hypothetical protein
MLVAVQVCTGVVLIGRGRQYERGLVGSPWRAAITVEAVMPVCPAIGGRCRRRRRQFIGNAPRSGRQSIGQTRDVPRLELREILEAAEAPRGRTHAADRIGQQRELMALAPEPRSLEPAAGCRVLGLEPGVEPRARSRDTEAA